MEDIGMYGYDDHWYTSSSVLAQLSKMMLKIDCVWGEVYHVECPDKRTSNIS